MKLIKSEMKIKIRIWKQNQRRQKARVHRLKIQINVFKHTEPIRS